MDTVHRTLKQELIEELNSMNVAERKKYVLKNARYRLLDAIWRFPKMRPIYNIELGYLDDLINDDQQKED